MTNNPVSRLLEVAGRDDLLTGMSLPDFVDAIIDQLPVLAAEFDTVHLKIDKDNVPFVAELLRLGQYARAVDDLVAQGHSRESASSSVDPDDFTFPRRLETYGALNPAVELAIPPDMAETIATDLARGRDLITPDTFKDIS